MNGVCLFVCLFVCWLILHVKCFGGREIARIVSGAVQPAVPGSRLP